MTFGREANHADEFHPDGRLPRGRRRAFIGAVSDEGFSFWERLGRVPAHSLHAQLLYISAFIAVATVINVFRDGVRSASDEPLLDGVPPVPCGETMGGQFFPLLFDPASIA